MQEIHLQFPTLGDWQKLTLTAIYQDAEATPTRTATRKTTSPPTRAPALSSVVSALVGMAEPWQGVPSVGEAGACNRPCSG